jgi:dolichyl-phosphate beta-glucosyltransferase
VIPALNETRRLPLYLHEIVTSLPDDGRYEVLVVDDGSTDDTLGCVAQVTRRHPWVQALPLGRHLGKGAAVQRGMLAGRGRFRLYADADGATPILEVKRLEAALETGAELAIGSRGRPDPAVSVTAQAHRVVAGRAFNWLVSWLGLRGIADTQCGFKALTARAAEDLFPRLRTRGLGFDVELLLLARQAGYRIVEVPVNWVDQAGGKVGVLKDGPAMLWESIKARARVRRAR